MIYKSYIVEEDIKSLKNSITLFYGENIGLQNSFKDQIKKFYRNYNILLFNQEDIFNFPGNFYNELNNESLFGEKKIFFIQNISDKFLKFIPETLKINKENKIYLFANLLEKKSKLRNLFEKEKSINIVPCYKDNELSIKKIITRKLKNYRGVSNEVINVILNNCNNDRAILKNEIEKIEIFFENKKLDLGNLIALLNVKSNDDFNFLKDSAMCGNKLDTNRLLSSTYVDTDKLSLYLMLLNQRLAKIGDVISEGNANIDSKIESLKPPIFWKDKTTFKKQTKFWSKNKIARAFKEIYKVEIEVKSKSILEKKIILKKLIIDICNLANAA